MIAYLLKIILCTSLFFVIYALLLEKERMHKFKRFYLLLSLALSFALPFVIIEVPFSVPFAIVENQLIVEEEILTNTEAVSSEATGYVANYSMEEEASSVSVGEFFVGLYLLISLSLLCRFVYNMFQMIIAIHRNEMVEKDGVKLVLIKELQTSHSFMNYIFLNKEEYINQQIEDEILIHEMVHVKQKHSYDIVFIEFLADEAVVQTEGDVVHYQMILLNKIHGKSKLSLASNFNYLITKKRLTMMTKISSKKMLALKIVALVPLFLVAVLLFSTHIVAEQKNELSLVSPESSEIEQDVKAQKKGLTKDEMDEFDKLVTKYMLGTALDFDEMTQKEQERFKSLKDNMSEEQLKKVPHETTVRFVPPRIKKENQKGLTEDELKEFKVLYEKTKAFRDNSGEKLTKKEIERMTFFKEKMSDAQLKEYPPLYKKTVRFVPPRIKQEKEGKGVSQELFDEYQNILKKYQTSDGKYNGIGSKITDVDRNRLKDLYKEMTYSQQDEFDLAVEEVLPLPPMKTLTDKEFESWKDAKVYGVWIDGKKVENSVLDNYSASDFSGYTVSKLYPNAKKDKDYSFQLDLTTNEGYKDRMERKKTEKPTIYYKEGIKLKKIG